MGGKGPSKGSRTVSKEFWWLQGFWVLSGFVRVSGRILLEFLLEGPGVLVFALRGLGLGAAGFQDFCLVWWFWGFEFGVELLTD